MAKKSVTNLKKNPNMLLRTELKDLPFKAEIVKEFFFNYSYRYTTGPFLLPENSGSLDWKILNNDPNRQKVRVTVYRCNLGSPKTAMPPGAVETWIDPYESTHNANEYDEGFSYEVVVECNSRLIMPYVSVWPGHYGVVIPGTGITAANFILQMPE